MKQSKQAFTLIEILVVVAIILILAAIVFPVFARARKNARRASCMSNLKQIGLGVMMYVQDYDATYPYAYMDYVVPNRLYWPYLFQPYTKSRQIFRCPSSPFAGDTSMSILYYAYGVNTLVIRHLGIGPGATKPPLKLAAVQAPSSTYMIMDWGTYYATPVYAYDSSWSNYYLPGEGTNGGDCSSMPAHTPRPVNYASMYDDCQNGRHFGGVNVVFADGHVKWLKSSKVVTEARKCRNGNNCDTINSISAWNPLLDNS